MDFVSFTQPLAVVIFPALGRCDDGQPVLGADGVAEPCDRPAGAEKIPKLPLAVQRGEVPDDVIVKMPRVGIGSHKKGVPALEEAHGERIAHAVCFLRRDLTGLKGLAHLIGDHVALLLSAGEVFCA